MIFKEHIKDVGYRPVFNGGELRDLGINPKSTGKGILYTWNANGSLRSVTDLQGTTYRFRYDAFGRRLEKRRMSSTFRFVWDGNVLLHETFKKDNSENTELTTWVFEGFVPTAKLVNGKAYSIISDHLGTPILAVDSDGMEVWNRQLDIYGRVRKEYKHSSLGDEVFPFVPFLYQGQYYDFGTNLAYNRYRYYSPETGAYISQDPIRLNGNNPTLYAYVKDNNCWMDRFGLEIIKIRSSDLKGGVHAPDATLNKALSRSADKRKGGPQGQWLSDEAIYKAANKYDQEKGGVQIVDIDKGDGHVVYNPVDSYPKNEGDKTYLVVDAAKAIIIPTNDGLHLFPIDETHPQYNSNSCN